MEKVVNTSGNSLLTKLICLRKGLLKQYRPITSLTKCKSSNQLINSEHSSGGFICTRCLRLWNSVGVFTCNRPRALSSLTQPNWDKSFIRGSFHKPTVFDKRDLKAFSALLDRSGFNTGRLTQLLISGCCSYSTNPKPGDEDREEEGKDDKKKDNDTNRVLRQLLTVCVMIIVFYFLFGRPSQVEHMPGLRAVSWNEFYHDMLARGEVKDIYINPESELALIQLHPGAIFKGRKVGASVFTMKVPAPQYFEEKVRKAEAELGIKPEDSVPIIIHRTGSLDAFFTMAVMGVLLYLLLRSARGVQLPNPSDMFASIRKAKFVRVDLMTQQGRGISFREVAGLQEAKIEIMEFVDYLKHPQRFKELGAKIPHGALLLGPPGCGKTLLARAVATEAKVPFLAMAGSEFVEMVGGLGAARVRDLFSEARKRSPCIIYIDEIDAIGRKRSGSPMGASIEEEQTLNQLLVEMDGMGTKEGVVVLASTNRADVLDKALLRPGRFDRHITIDLPTMIERLEIFEMYLRKLKILQPVSTYAPKLAQLTPGMSGADIANICNEAAIHAAREKKKAIEAEDFDYALERVIAGVEKKSHLLSPSEKKVVAYHESGHALVGWMLKYTDALLRISIVPRTNSVLGFAQYMPSDQKLYSTEELFERMCMALGGRVAEAVIFNHITTGAEDDLKKVTKMAYNQIQSYGMNPVIGQLSFPDKPSGELGTKPYSKKLASIIDLEARKLVASAYHRTEELLLEHKAKLHLMATKLLEKEVMTYDDIKQLIGPPPFGEKNKIEPHGWEGIMPSNGDLARPVRQKPESIPVDN